MNYISKIFILLIFLLPYQGIGQSKMVCNYYDNEKKQIKEIFYLSDSVSSWVHGPYTSYYANGKLKANGFYVDNQPSGNWTYYYENGNVKMRGPLKEAANHGLWKYYYENGHLSREGHIENGKKQDEWSYYYENGELKSQGRYMHDIKDGIWNYFYEDGILKAQIFYEDNEGTYQEFYSSGKLKAEGINIDEKSQGVWKYYYENGALKAEGYYKDGIKQDEWKFYHPNGEEASSGNFKDGLTSGTWKYYNEEGKLVSEGIETDGKKDGYWKLYYSTGQLKGEGNFVEGDGDYQEFYENGKLKLKGHIKNGKNDGKWIYYDDEGKLEGECVFTEGEGIYYGYYANGNVKMEGKIKNDQKVGIWKLYRRDGDLIGYYKPYYENEKPIYKVLSDTTDLTAQATDYEKPEFRFRNKKTRYFTPRINEFHGIICSSNPAAVFMGQLPASVEYYIWERLGYEFQYTWVRQPFFDRKSKIKDNKVFTRGYTLDIRQKFYQNDGRIGMLYFGHELRYSNLNHYANTTDTVYSIRKTLASSEQKVEYSIIVGDRFLEDSDKQGWTLDVFIGVGVGCRWYKRNYESTPDNDHIFINTPKNKLVIPFRFGVSIGYMF